MHAACCCPCAGHCCEQEGGRRRSGGCVDARSVAAPLGSVPKCGHKGHAARLSAAQRTGVRVVGDNSAQARAIAGRSVIGRRVWCWLGGFAHKFAANLNCRWDLRRQGTRRGTGYGRSVPPHEQSRSYAAVLAAPRGIAFCFWEWSPPAARAAASPGCDEVSWGVRGAKIALGARLTSRRRPYAVVLIAVCEGARRISRELQHDLCRQNTYGGIRSRPIPNAWGHPGHGNCAAGLAENPACVACAATWSRTTGRDHQEAGSAPAPIVSRSGPPVPSTGSIGDQNEFLGARHDRIRTNSGVGKASRLRSRGRQGMDDAAANGSGIALCPCSTDRPTAGSFGSRPPNCTRPSCFRCGSAPSAGSANLRPVPPCTAGSFRAPRSRETPGSQSAVRRGAAGGSGRHNKAETG